MRAFSHCQKITKKCCLVIEKSLFGTKISWKNGNYRRKMLGKMEILRIFALEKWNFLLYNIMNKLLYD